MQNQLSIVIHRICLLTVGVCLCRVLLPACAAEESLRVTVDPRIELMSIMFRLAGNPEYNQGRVQSYIRDVESHFGEFRDHEAVQLARTLRNRHGVSYDAVMGYAVHLTDEFDAVVPFSQRPETLDARWRSGNADTFLDKLQRFAKDSDFNGFFRDHASLYTTAITRMEEVAEEHGHFEWFDQFFGAWPGASFTVVLGLLNGGACYGARTLSEDGKENLYCVLGVWSTDLLGKPKFDKGMLSTVAHEFCHSYVNPVVYANDEGLRNAGRQLYPWVAKEMQRQAYGTWLTMMHESLVRASVVRYAFAFEGEKAAQRQIEYQVKQRHFLWTPELVELLAEYEANRDQYPDFESFFPRVIEFFNDYAPAFARKMEQQGEKAPKVASMTPENGARDVDPDLEAITITFDRPMGGGYSFVGGGPHYPETIGRPEFDSTRKTVTLKVKLKPDWDYEFWLNRGKFNSFRSEDGVSLKPVRVEFRTGASGSP